MKSKKMWVLSIGVTALVLCCCVEFVILAGMLIWTINPTAQPLALSSPGQQDTPSAEFQTSTSPTSNSTATPEPTISPSDTSTNDEIEGPNSSTNLEDQLGFVDPAAYETLLTLQNTYIPVNDLRELAQRLLGVRDIPLLMEDDPIVYQTGDKELFWVTNMDTDLNFQVTCVLRYITDHSYFWIQEGVNYDALDLQLIAEAFEYEIYPIDREFFGSEWTPGIDNDPHIYIIYAGDLGASLGGYYSSLDSVHPLAHEYSNAHEAFVFNSDNVFLSDSYTYGVLAHEFQHMIHFYHKAIIANSGISNSDTWLNEMCSLTTEDFVAGKLGIDGPRGVA
ncbi:MAG: hypothetical protein MUO76_09610, partial [Anaerolineaceae bacterium]|nr:hypothetical protein [Anaerolineaceae bacterium]